MHNLTDRLASEGCAVVALTLATRYNHLGSFVLLKTLMLTLPHWWVKSCRGWAMGASGEEAWWSFSFPVVTYSFVLQTSVTCWVNYHMVLWNGKNSYFCLLSLDNWTCTLGCFRRQAFLFLTNMLDQFVLEGNLLQSRGVSVTPPRGWALDVLVSLQTKVWQSLEMLFPGLLLTHLSGGCSLRQENLSSFLLSQVFLTIAKAPIILPFVSGFLKSVYSLLVFSNYY